MVDNMETESLGEARRDIPAKCRHLAGHCDNGHDAPGNLLSAPMTYLRVTATLPFGSVCPRGS